MPNLEPESECRQKTIQKETNGIHEFQVNSKDQKDDKKLNGQ